MLPVAPIIWSGIVGALAAGMTSLVGRVVLALGISYVSFQGLDILFSNLASAIQSNMGGIPAELSAWLGILKVQTSINIITTAFTTRLALSAIGGTIKRAVLK